MNLVATGSTSSYVHQNINRLSPKTLAVPYPSAPTQASPATRTEFMAEASTKALKAILETIRERADYALKQIQESGEERSTRWRCKDCEYVKHFTRPVPLESANRCPRCKSTSFEAIS
jgi:predicted Zn-ribbon and HTH transcriptional regulator